MGLPTRRRLDTEAIFGTPVARRSTWERRNAEPTERVVMPSYRIVYGDNEQVVRETYHGVDVDREGGWTTLFRGEDAILRMRDEHVQSVEVFDEAAPGEPAWKPV